jgi:hypothetical protein
MKSAGELTLGGAYRAGGRGRQRALGLQLVEGVTNGLTGKPLVHLSREPFDQLQVATDHRVHPEKLLEQRPALEGLGATGLGPVAAGDTRTIPIRRVIRLRNVIGMRRRA